MGVATKHKESKSPKVKRQAEVRLEEENKVTEKNVNDEFSKSATQNNDKHEKSPTSHKRNVEIKSPEPERAALSPDPKNELAGIRSALKKVPHVASSKSKSLSEKHDSLPEEDSYPT